MNFSIVLSTHSAQFQAVAFKGDFKSSVSRIASFGYTGVELAVRDPNLLDHDEVISTLEDQKLKLPAIGTGQAWGEEGLSFTEPDPDIRRRAIERVLSHIPLAKRTGALIIIGLIRGVVQDSVPMKQAETWLMEALKVCAEKARGDGVRIALEPLNRYETPMINSVSQGLSFIEEAGAENLGLLLDTFHMNIEEPSIEESIRRCKKKIFHFHVADSNRWYPGAGHLDFRSILTTLSDTGYQGYISGEFMPQPSAEVSARRAIEYLRGLKIC